MAGSMPAAYWKWPSFVRQTSEDQSMSWEKYFWAKARASGRDLPWMEVENSENLESFPTFALTAGG